jgi:hypothetical protein
MAKRNILNKPITMLNTICGSNQPGHECNGYRINGKMKNYPMRKTDMINKRISLQQANNN